MAAPTEDRADRAKAPRTLAEKARRLIYDDIVSGRLAPSQKLKPGDLTERYGVGTSPIREALLRLSAEGLVKLEGQRGFSVPPKSEDELRDITRLRCLLSCRALALAIEQGDDRWEAGVFAAFHRLEAIAGAMKREPARHREEWDRRNLEFHAALEAACGSPWLLRLSALAVAQSERYRRNTLDYDKLLPAVQHDHRAIMNAALRRDARQACALLTRHIESGGERVLRALARERPAHRAGAPRAKRDTATGEVSKRNVERIVSRTGER